MNLQSVIRFLYPPQCLSCGAETMQETALCGACWGETPFISGLVCDACGLPLPDSPGMPEMPEYCDSCLHHPPPWRRGRAAMLYEGIARRLILALKDGDRTDLAPAVAGWLAPHARMLADDRTLLVPVPLSRARLFLRRYNQAALLGGALARRLGIAHCPDLLMRVRNTRRQKAMSRAQRHRNQAGAIRLAPALAAHVENRPVLLLDDVMTSGATLAACSEACLGAGAAEVSVLVLARVARDTQIV